MSRKMKKYGCFLLIFCLMINLAGCQKDSNQPLDEAPSIVPITEGEISPEVTFSAAQMRNIVYYTLSDSMTKEEATAVLAEDTTLTPEYMVDYVVKSMENVLLEIDVDAVMIENASVIVSFAENTVPVINTSAALETEILDCIAQSILENCDEYTSVIYRIMNEAYHSKNKSFDLNHIYLGN